MTTIIVWGRRNSVNVQKVMWAIGEMNLKYIRHDVSGSFGVNDNYLRLNPSGSRPLSLITRTDSAFAKV